MQILIACLGNGENAEQKYQCSLKNTVHNAGAHLGQALLERCGPFPLQRGRGSQFTQIALPGRYQAPPLKATLAFPDLTDLNGSGNDLLLDFPAQGENRPDALCVLIDDLDLPTGTWRFRRSGSDGGHRGLRNVMAAYPDHAVMRVRVGMGRPPEGFSVSDWVKHPLNPEQLQTIQTCADELTSPWQSNNLTRLIREAQPTLT